MINFLKIKLLIFCTFICLIFIISNGCGGSNDDDPSPSEYGSKSGSDTYTIESTVKIDLEITNLVTEIVLYTSKEDDDIITLKWKNHSAKPNLTTVFLSGENMVLNNSAEYQVSFNVPEKFFANTYNANLKIEDSNDVEVTDTIEVKVFPDITKINYDVEFNSSSGDTLSGTIIGRRFDNDNLYNNSVVLNGYQAELLSINENVLEVQVTAPHEKLSVINSVEATVNNVYRKIK